MGLFNSTVPTVKLDKIGDEFGGTIIGFDKQHRTEFGTGTPMYWSNRKPTAGVAVDPQTGKDNDPVMDPVVLLDTGNPDEFGETQRRLIVKGQMLADIREACREAQVRDVRERGQLFGKWVSGQARAGSPRKFKFTYTPPTAGILGAVPAQSNDEEAPF